MYVSVDVHSALVNTARLTKAFHHSAALADDLLCHDDLTVLANKG